MTKKTLGLGFSLAVLLASVFVSLPQTAEARLSKKAKVALGVAGVAAVGVGAYQIGKKRERERRNDRYDNQNRRRYY